MATNQSRTSRRRKPATLKRSETIAAAKFVWCDPTGLGRNVFVLFRRSFSLSAGAMKDLRQAEIRVFADTRYRLWVNGQIVSYGPARFVPSHPEYDPIDLRPWLRKGRNAIVVEANSFGTKQYNAMPSIGGFIAFGTIRAGKTTVDLGTPGEWKMQRAEAWDGDAPAFSFAQTAVEICDARLLPPGVREAEFDDANWPAPVHVENQAAWGTPIARTIPPLTMDLHEPEKLMVSSALLNDEEVIGGRLPGDRPAGENGGPVRFCYAVNIYSPMEQDAMLGLFWGPHYLNGQEILAHKPSTERAAPAWNDTRSMPYTAVPSWCTDRGNRQDYPVHLREGWNFLYGEPEVLRGQQGILLGLPIGKGMVASADRDPNAAHAMIFSEGMPIGVLHAARGPEIPSTMEALPSLPVPWHRVERGSIPPLPARLIGWDIAADHSPPVRPQQVCELHIPADTPWTLVFDLGRELMGHVALDLSAPAGTIIDVAYDERLRDNGMVAIYHSQWILDSADRFIAAGGRQTIEGFHGRACRFVQISIRNAAGPVTLHRVHYRQTILPMDVQGRFESSDPVLDWLYSACIDTIRPCTDSILNADALRENAMYINDTVPIYNSLSAFFGDPAMMRRCLRLYAHAQSPEGGIPVVVPGWWAAGGSNAWFVYLLSYYLRNTGDLALLHELWPNVVRTLDMPTEFGPRGLLDIGNREGWFDWGMNPEVTRGESFNPNAHYFGGRQYAANLATIVKDTKHARQYRADAARMKSAYQQLWDPAHHRYAPTLVDGKPLEVSLPHPNVLALYFGLAEPDKIAGALACVEHWLSDEKFLAPGHLELAYHFWALEVLYEHDRAALAEHVIRRTWGILKNFGSWSIWETVGLALHGDQQLCQGWGTAPLMIMARRILGVRPSPESHRHVLIAPHAETLRFARGAVAHPDGPIEVDWRICGEGDRQWLALNVAAPRSVKVQIQPRGMLAKMPMRETVRRYPAHKPG